MGPLTGLKVLELSALGPVPFCGMLMGDMGAEILRIDRIGSSDLGIEFPTQFDLRNRNKRSVAIDLKRAEGRAAFMHLVGQADVVLEGFRPGVAERLGIGPGDCFLHQPKLVYGRGTGWGQDGPLAQSAGHDINYIALTGALDLIGPRGGAPVPPLNLLGDYGGGGVYLAFGVLCALFEARSSNTGQVVDAAMVDGVTSLMTVVHALRQMGQLTPERGSNVLDGGAPYYTTYLARDGHYVAVGAIEPVFYAALLERLDLDPENMPRQNDRSRWPELRARIAERFLSRTREEWIAHFDGSDACFSPVLSVEEVANHPHNMARGVLTEFGGVVHPRPAPRLSRTPGAILRGAPRRAEHTETALRDWGFKAHEISAGLAAGVFVDLDSR
jgi:alpha-methylacyl-CoA racemase